MTALMPALVQSVTSGACRPNRLANSCRFPLLLGISASGRRGLRQICYVRRTACCIRVFFLYWIYSVACYYVTSHEFCSLA